MYEPDNLREARIEDLQDMNLDVLYAVCDLLGMDDLIKGE
jgi:hypothetical protein